MSIISAADTGDAGLPEIANSLRLDGGDDYLSKTVSTTGNRSDFTMSGWFKRSKLGSQQDIAWAGSASNIYTYIGFASDDTLVFVDVYGGTAYIYYTTAMKFRDPSAWVHIVVRVEGGAGAGNKVKFYVNGAEVAKVMVYDSPDSTRFNLSGETFNLFRDAGVGGTPTYYYDGYCANLCWLDGSLKVGSDFAYTDPNNQWRTLPASQLKALADAGGTNSFFLEFKDGASTTTLGTDSSSKGNNWTLNNMVRAAGSTECWMQDTPTNNFATLNPLHTGLNTGSTVVLSNGNLTYTSDASISQYRTWYSTIPLSNAGYWYFEFYVSGVGTADTDAQRINVGSQGFYQSGKKTGGVAYGSAWAATNTIGVAVSPTGMWVHINGTWQGGATLSEIVSGDLTHSIGSVGADAFVSVGDFSATSDSYTSGSLNFGQRTFAYTPPTGFKALCTKNMPVPTGAAAEPAKNFMARVDTGSTGVRNVTGLLFSPDLVITKNRAGSSNRRWGVIDKVRGVNKTLTTGGTSGPDAEVTSQTDLLTAFNSDGYTIGADAGLYGWNGYVESYVSFCWKAGDAAVSNTQGTGITSQVSANTAAGFSVVTFTGTGNAAHTVGHGLGVTPKMVILKKRSGSASWMVKHESLSSNANLLLNGTGRAYTNSEAGGFGSGIVDSLATNTFGFVAGGVSPNTVDNVNANGATFVAYCFADVPYYQKIGSYVGTGDANGPNIWCGFKPRFVMIKRTDSVASWIVWDSARSTYNQVQDYLVPNLTNADANNATVSLDFVSNGFKVRGTDPAMNTTSGTYIYIAIAEQPFQWSNAK